MSTSLPASQVLSQAQDDSSSYTPLYLPPAALIELEQSLRNGCGAQVSSSSLQGCSVLQEQDFAASIESSAVSSGLVLINVPDNILEQMSTLNAGSTATTTGAAQRSNISLNWFQREFWSYYMDLVEGEEHSATRTGVAHDQPNQASAQGTSAAAIGQSQKHVLGSSLPLARIKKVMKSDEAVKMISTEAPMLLARACEIFIADLTSRAYTVAEESRRKMITKQDVMAATTQTDMFDFLLDILPRKSAANEASQETWGPGDALARERGDAVSEDEHDEEHTSVLAAEYNSRHPPEHHSDDLAHD